LMGKDASILVLNLPSPPNQNLWRDTAGGFGTSIPYPSNMKVTGQTPLHPFLPYSTAVLKGANKKFNVIDCQRLNLNNAETVKKVLSLNPEIIVSMISLPSMRNDLDILSEIKKSLQNVVTIGVGVVCRVIPNEVLADNKIDIILRNSYPYINGLLDLIDALQNLKPLKSVDGLSYRENGQVIHTADLPEYSFDNLPFPDYDLIPFEGYETISDESGRRQPYVLIIDSKGCPYGCSYCAYPLGYGKQFTFRSPTSIVDEIEYLQQNRQVNVFAFKGQSFAYNKAHAVKVCEEILRRGLKVEWFCEARADEINQEYISKMKRSGCRRVHFGVETGDPETLKVAKPGVTLDITRRAFRLARAYGIARQGHVILGWPQDNFRTLDNTRRFLLEIDPDVINLNFMTPYPGTKVYQTAIEKGLLLTRDWSNYTSHSVVMKTESLNAKQLYAIKNKIVRDFSLHKLEKMIFNFSVQDLEQPKIFAAKAQRLAKGALFPEIN
jgi:anaerobic magnesium-protoporphyrin IX monomethyl ester cyclase